MSSTTALRPCGAATATSSTTSSTSPSKCECAGPSAHASSARRRLARPTDACSGRGSTVMWCPLGPRARAMCKPSPALPSPASNTASSLPIPSRATRMPASLSPIVCARRAMPRRSSGSPVGRTRTDFPASSTSFPSPTSSTSEAVSTTPRPLAFVPPSSTGRTHVRSSSPTKEMKPRAMCRRAVLLFSRLRR